MRNIEAEVFVSQVCMMCVARVFASTVCVYVCVATGGVVALSVSGCVCVCCGVCGRVNGFTRGLITGMLSPLPGVN